MDCFFKVNRGVPVAVLFFLFPLGMSSVRHYSSTFLVFMVLVALWGGLNYRCRLSAQYLQIIYAFLAFLVVISLSLFNAHDLEEGFRVLGKMAYFTVLIPLYYAARKIPGSLVCNFIWGLVCAAPINFIIALYSVYFQEMTRAQGFYHPIIFGDLSLLGAMILTVFLFSGYPKDRLLSFFGPISIVCYLLSCYLSGTRGAWATLPVAMSVAILLYRNSLHKKLVAQIMIGLIFLSGSIYGLQGILPDRALSPVQGKGVVLSTLNNISDFRDGENLNSSIGQRFLMWGISLEMMKSNPLLGSGLGGFEEKVKRLQRDDQTALNRAWPHAHSIYFEFLGTTGVLGLLALLVSLFIVPASFFVKSLSGSKLQNFSASAGLVFLVCFAVFGVSECWLFRSPMLITYIVCLFVFTIGCSLEKNNIPAG